MINCFLHCNNAQSLFFLNSETTWETLWKYAVKLMASSPVSHIMSQDADCYGSIQASLVRAHCCECPQRDRVRQSTGNKWPQCWRRPGRADDKLRLQRDSSSPSHDAVLQTASKHEGSPVMICRVCHVSLICVVHSHHSGAPEEGSPCWPPLSSLTSQPLKGNRSLKCLRY